MTLGHLRPIIAGVSDTGAEIIAEYERKRDVFERYAAYLHSLLSSLLAETGLRPHVITHRVKNRASLERKVARPNKEYQFLSEITDIAGVRVITYFAAEVDRIAEVVEAEFEVDRKNTIDKRASLDPDRFGYLSVHYVISLKRSRADLMENKLYAGLKAEVQIRSILQHAWAENEHDLGYKARESVPSVLRRRWARLAGLLELADSEFEAIRRETSDYASDATTGIPSLGESDIPLDLVSLRAFTRENSVVRSLENDMAEAVGAKLRDDDRLVQESVPQLHELGIATIGDLQRKLEEHRNPILAMTKLRMTGFSNLSRGTEYLFLAYILLSWKGKVDEIVTFFERHDIGLAGRREALARVVLEQGLQVRAAK